MAVNSSLTFSAVLAEVSKNKSPASRAYASASEAGMARLSGCSVTRSSLFPASAMMMFSLAWRWSSLTHALALSRDDYDWYVNNASGPASDLGRFNVQLV